MTKEQILYDLQEREGICYYDGDRLPNQSKQAAKRQVMDDLMNSGLKSFEAHRALREAQE